MKRFISTVRTKMRTLCLLFAILPISVSFCSCRDKTTNNSRQMPKTIIYQLLPRLYSNTREVNKINGSINENGCGKLNEINDAALDNIASLSALMFGTQVWCVMLQQPNIRSSRIQPMPMLLKEMRAVHTPFATTMTWILIWQLTLIIA